MLNMDALKAPKSELIAIYRLEFYKKQKSWKLYTDARKYKNDDIEKKNLLNKTYDVEDPKTESCHLNEAFLNADSDKSNTTFNPQGSWQTVPTESKCSTYDSQNAVSMLQENEQNDDHYPQNFIHSDSILKEPGTEEVCTEGAVDCYYSTLDFTGFNRYPGGELKCCLNNNGNCIQMQEDEQFRPKDHGDNAANILCRSADWLWTDEHLLLPGDGNLRWTYENAYNEGERETASERSVDSWSEFVRGANMVPHSSELELTLPSALSDLDINAQSLACLTSAQLNEAVRAHTTLLKCLLEEENQRRRIRSCLSLTNRTAEQLEFSPCGVTKFNSYDVPTRDTDPYFINHTTPNSLERETTFTKTPEDLFVAGSYKNGDLGKLGRGRGRMQNVEESNSKRVIGIGRGRPFRL